VVLEAWVAGGNALTALNRCSAFSEQARDGEGHSDAVITKAGKRGSMQFGASFDFHAIGTFGDVNAHEAQVVGNGGDAVGLLHSELLSIANERFATGESSSDGKNG